MAQRYSRQTILTQIGRDGQEKLQAATIVIAGVGALGSTMAEMLARAGVGTLRLIDRDYLELHNLQRQSLYTEADVEDGLPKAAAASRHLREINSGITVQERVADITPENVLELLEGSAIVLDGTDNLQTRYLLNDACIELGIPWVYSGVIGVSGVSMTVVPGETPCLQCLYPNPPPPGTTETCDVAGVLGPAAHAIAAIAAAEAIKLVVGGSPAVGMLVGDIWAGTWDRFEVPRNPGCIACDLGVLNYLNAEAWDSEARLCGHDAVQIRLPNTNGNINLTTLGQRLKTSGTGEVLANEYLIRLRTGQHELTIFPDGRVIVKGTEDATTARSLAAKYIGT
ncbi:MAG: ThiF family adenylyltransferase [Chloroflexia bacterium]